MKVFLTKNSTKKELRSLMKILAKNCEVKKLHFNNQATKVRGLYDYNKSSIFIDNKQTKKNMLLAFFHELAHHKATKTASTQSRYHKGTVEVKPKHAFLLENKTDKLASTLWKQHVDINVWGKYKYVYPKTQKNMLTKWLKKYYKQ